MFLELLYDNCFADDEQVRQAAAEKLEQMYNCQISAVEMAADVVFAHHARGCTIRAAKICEGVAIFQNVTIGVNDRFNKRTGTWENIGNPIIGAHVTIADGAKIFGPIVVGEGSFVAAGAIVTRDVPPNSLVFGVNQIKPKDPDIDYVYHDPMIDPELLMVANKKRIAEYLASTVDQQAPRTPGAWKGRMEIPEGWDEFTQTDEQNWYGDPPHG